MRALLLRLRFPLVIYAYHGDARALRRLRVVDALLDVMDLPWVWRMKWAHRARIKGGQ